MAHVPLEGALPDAWADWLNGKTRGGIYAYRDLEYYAFVSGWIHALTLAIALMEHGEVKMP